MSVTSILAPAAGTFIGLTNPDRLGTRDPKEVAFSPSGSFTITHDLGTIQSVDTVFLGYTTGGIPLSVNYSVGGGEVLFGSGSIAPAQGNPLAPVPTHYLSVLDAPVTARYIILRGTFPGVWQAGVMAAGDSFRPTWGYEYGGGRFIVDTGNVSRLKSGGFGIDEGAIAGGWNWSFGDLTDANLRDLYALLRSLGESRTALVVEDPASALDLHFGIHWGLFQKIDAYERLIPNASRWSLKFEEWAA